MAWRVGWGGCEDVLERGDLTGDPGKVLGERIVQFDGEACSFLKPEVGTRVGRPFAQERFGSLFDESVERPVPDGCADQQEDEQGDGDQEPRGSPPGRTCKDEDVFR